MSPTRAKRNETTIELRCSYANDHARVVSALADLLASAVANSATPAGTGAGAATEVKRGTSTPASE